MVVQMEPSSAVPLERSMADSLVEYSASTMVDQLGSRMAAKKELLRAAPMVQTTAVRTESKRAGLLESLKAGC